MGKTVEIRVKAKAQNAILARLADKLGGNEAAAKELGISSGTFSIWLNFRGKPGHRWLRTERYKRLLLKLERLTERSIKDIFSLTKEEMAILAKPRVSEHVVETERLTYAVEQEYMSYTPTDPAESKELRARIQDELKTLTYREREIIKMRFGLDGGVPYTLEEVARVFRVGKERIWQIESKALRKLQQPSRSQGLVGFLD